MFNFPHVVLCVRHIANKFIDKSKLLRTPKYFILFICVCFILTLCFFDNTISYILSPEETDLINEALHNVEQDNRYIDVYRRPDKLSKDIKYVLLWTSQEYAPFYYLGNGQRNFIKNNCSFTNCYVTEDRNFFGGDTTRFDAIAFNGRNLKGLKRSSLPQKRAPHQKFIYYNMESADIYPVCYDKFDDFFNWTATYRLDSDIPTPYVLIRDNNGNIVGPKRNMKWLKDMPELDEDLINRLNNKTGAVAWIVSNCRTPNMRFEYTRSLQKALKPYGLNVDIYGACGTRKCFRNKDSDCYEKLKTHYSFYLSFENSFAEDYVTEKVLTALHHDVIPIVYGGAHYPRFLPPNSYLDGIQHSTMELAAMIARLMSSKKLYQQYFKWKSVYSYSDPTATNNVCALCEALNNEEMMRKQSTYKEFRKWWYPPFKSKCANWFKKLISYSKPNLI